jgi:transposase
MVVVDGKGLPLGISVVSASPAEVTLVSSTLKTVSVPRCGPGRPRSRPERLIGDRAYDSDPLRRSLARRGIELVCPHRSNRVRAKTQDGRKLRRYRRRWIIERTIAWYGAFRRLVVRYERLTSMYLAFFHFASAIIALRWF